MDRREHLRARRGRDAGGVLDAGGVVTGYVIDERNPTGHAKPIEEYEGGAVSRAYVLGCDIIAQASMDAGMEVAYLLKDGHGSTRALVTL